MKTTTPPATNPTVTTPPKAAATKADADSTVRVEATGPVRHGVGDKVEDYVEGDTFNVTRREAVSLVLAGAVRKPGSSPEADAESTAADKAAIDEANAKADAERAEAAKAEAARLL
jgi:hypothetical protein